MRGKNFPLSLGGPMNTFVPGIFPIVPLVERILMGKV